MDTTERLVTTLTCDSPIIKPGQSAGERLTLLVGSNYRPTAESAGTCPLAASAANLLSERLRRRRGETR